MDSKSDSSEPQFEVLGEFVKVGSGVPDFEFILATAQNPFRSPECPNKKCSGSCLKLLSKYCAQKITF
jgi:hypothetical protein